MKKIFLTCLLSAICTLTSFAVDYSGTCGTNLTWELTDGVLTISGTGAMDDYSGATAPWITYINGNVSIVIEEGVTTIGKNAFIGTNNIQINSISLPSTLLSIGEGAFLSNNSLLSVIIPNNVTEIGQSAFQACTNLSSVMIGNSVTKIGNFAFVNCKKITSIIIPNSVTSIGQSAFSQCFYLSEISIGSNVKSIQEGCFQDCIRLNSVEIPNSVISIGDACFSGNTQLSVVHIGTGIQSIGMSAFYHCYNFKELYIDAETPPSLNYSFWETGLEKVYVPCNSVTAYESSSWGSYTIIGLGGNCESKPQSNSKFWNMSDAAFNSLGTISSTTTVDGLTIHASSSKNVVIDESIQEIDGQSFTHRLKFGGTGSNDARCLSFHVDGDCDIDVYLMSASGSADRTLNVDKGSFGSSLQQIDAPASAITKGSIHYTGGATTIYLYSPNSGVNIYAIRVTYGGNQEGMEDVHIKPQDEAHKILHNGQIFILRGDKTYTLQGQEVK